MASAAAFAVILLFAGVIALSSILNGWVLSILWGWFFVPILKLPPLTVPQAIGIALVVGYFTRQKQPSSKSSDEAYETIGYAFLAPLVTLLIGWIVKGFM